MREGGRGCGVGQVIGRHVNCLYRGDRALFRRGDSLLERTHFGGKGRLITDGGGHSAKKGGNLRACLGETENIIDEQKNVLSLSVAEIFRHCQTAESDAHSRSGRLVHLTVDKCGLGKNAGFLHFVIKVVALACTLADTCEYRDAAVLLGNVVDQLHDQDGFTNARTAEQTDLAALGIRSDQVDDLDSCLENLRGTFLLVIFRGLSVNFPALSTLDGLSVVDGLAEKVENTSEGLGTYGHRDALARINCLHAARHTVGG